MTRGDVNWPHMHKVFCRSLDVDIGGTSKVMSTLTAGLVEAAKGAHRYDRHM